MLRLAKRRPLRLDGGGVMQQMGYRIMGIVTRVGLWLGGGLRIGWSPIRFMGSPVVTVTKQLAMRPTTALYVLEVAAKTYNVQHISLCKLSANITELTVCV